MLDTVFFVIVDLWLVWGIFRRALLEIIIVCSFVGVILGGIIGRN